MHIFKRIRRIGTSLSARQALVMVSITACMMLVLSFASYHVFKNAFDEEIMRFNMQKLNTVATSVDTNIFAVAEKVCATTLWEGVSGSGNALYSQHGPREYMNTINKVKNILVTNRLALLDFAESLNVFYPSKNIIISSLSGATFLDTVNTPGWIRDDEWIDLYKTARDEQKKSSCWLKPRVVTNSAIPTQSETVYTYVFTLTGIADSSGSALLMLNINEQTLRQKIADLDYTYDSSLMLLDSDGFIVSHADSSLLFTSFKDETCFQKIKEKPALTQIAKLNGVEVVISSVKSNLPDLYYVYIVEASEYYHKSKIIKDTIILIVASFLCIGIVLSIFASHACSRPLRKLIQSTRAMVMPDYKEKRKFRSTDTVNGNNDITLISNTIESLYSRVSNLDATLEHNRDIMENALFSNLLAGAIFTEEDLIKQLVFINRDFTLPLYNAIVMKLNLAVISVQETCIEDIIQRAIGYIRQELETVAVTVINNTTFAVIVNYSDPEDADGVIHHLIRFFTFKMQFRNIPAYFGIGKPVKSLIDISISYQQACDSLEYAVLFPRNLSFWSETFQDRGLSTQQADCILSNYTDALNKGNAKLLIEITGNLENILRQDASIEDYRNIREHILYETNKAMVRYKSSTTHNVDETILQTLHDAKNAEEFIANLNILNYSLESRNTVPSNVLYTQKAQKYILTNLGQPLSAKYLANMLCISTEHFSRVFKDVSGESFSFYLNRIRMETARDLLYKGEITPQKVAEQTGFKKNYSYFIRKFKAEYGMTPRQYQQSVHVRKTFQTDT